MKEFDQEAVAEFNGKDGKPAYIVHQGRVYDVTNSKLWKNGSHMRRHTAGQDLTIDFGAAPHGTEVLERYQQVGVIKQQQAAEAETRSMLYRILERYPILTRHPHPMTVHFPIVFMFATAAFNGLYLLTGNRSFEVTGLHCLAAGILFLPIVTLTGLFSWWLNYMAKPIKPIVVKLWASLALWIVAMMVFTWRITAPEILVASDAGRHVYLVLVMSLAVLVTIIGWFGAKLTFPVEKGV
jgi:predicted heme/steroid binding protein/uncharacterized membrane protein